MLVDKKILDECKAFVTTLTKHFKFSPLLQQQFLFNAPIIVFFLTPESKNNSLFKVTTQLAVLNGRENS